MPCVTSTSEGGNAQDSLLGSLSDSRAVTNLGDARASFITRMTHANAKTPFEGGGILLCPPLLEGPSSTFYFVRGCKTPMNEAKGGEEEEKTVTDTTKVFRMSMGLEMVGCLGGTSREGDRLKEQ